MITNYKIMNVKNNTSSSSLLHNQRGNYNKSNKYTYNYSDNVAIHSLDIADGLKELLTKYELTLNDLLNMPSSELAEYLGIDKYVAHIIGSALRNYLTLTIRMTIEVRKLHYHLGNFVIGR